jgi:hypothetical protein
MLPITRERVGLPAFVAVAVVPYGLRNVGFTAIRRSAAEGVLDSVFHSEKEKNVEVGRI